MKRWPVLAVLTFLVACHEGFQPKTMVTVSVDAEGACYLEDHLMDCADIGQAISQTYKNESIHVSIVSPRTSKYRVVNNIARSLQALGIDSYSFETPEGQL